MCFTGIVDCGASPTPSTRRGFLPSARSAIPRFAYLPFGIGPRTCIGSSFALQEATVVLAVLISNFDMRLSPEADVWPVQRITLRPANGLPMKTSSHYFGVN
jgi:cytochrome P450